MREVLIIDKNEFLKEQLDLFVCKSISLANYLISNKATLVKIDKDKENRKFLVFLFETNPILVDALEKWRK